MWRLESKKVLVTGGTKGIGKACVEQFLELGAEVLFTSRTSKDVQDLENEFKDHGYQVKGLVADASKLSDSEKVSNWISENWSSLHVLVNNAGRIQLVCFDFEVYYSGDNLAFLSSKYLSCILSIPGFAL